MRVLKARLLEDRAGEAGGRDRGRAQEDGRLGRPLREDPHLQLPAVAHHRPPHRLHDPPPGQDVLDGNLDELVEPLTSPLPGGAAEGRAGEGVRSEAGRAACGVSRARPRSRGTAHLPTYDGHRRDPRGAANRRLAADSRRDRLGRAAPARAHALAGALAAGLDPRPDARSVVAGALRGLWEKRLIGRARSST